MAKHLIGLGMAQQWLRNAQDPNGLIKNLKNSGVNFIEIGVNRKVWELQLPWLDYAHSLGMRSSFHFPYYGEYFMADFRDEPDNAVKNAYFDLFSRIGGFCRSKGYTGIVNMHCADSEELSEEELYSITVSFFGWLYKSSFEYNWPLEFVVEILPFNPSKIKWGELPEQLVKLKKKVSFLRGFCWDLGHYTWNCYKKREEKLPRAFLKDVRHIHLHDFKNLEENLDHYPLKFGVVKWEEYIRMVSSKSLNIVLELDYRNTQSCGEAYEELFASIAKLKDFLGSFQAKAKVK